MSNDLISFTLEEINQLSGYVRSDALRLYHKWLKKERQNDVREARNYYNKLNKFLKRRGL